MTDLFAGIAVREYGAAKAWYERFFGKPPSFLPNEIEAVWEVGEHRYVYIIETPERAGYALHLIFVENLTEIVEGLKERGFEPAEREDYEHGVTKITYRDPDGNEFAYGGSSAG